VNQGSRRGSVPRVRSEIAERLAKELGMSLAGAARLSGGSTSAISKILRRTTQKNIGVIRVDQQHPLIGSTDRKSAEDLLSSYEP
jgi:predicted transcriptional regulator